MKANRLILSAIVAIMGVMSTIAQDIVSIDSIHLLSMEQKQTIQFVKKQLNQDKTGLELPLEVNYLLGDTITKTNYKVKPKWEDAYFIKADSVVMIVPLYNESLNLLQCQLRVENTAQNVFFQQIETLIGTSNEENDKFTGSMVYSNNLGNLIKIYSFENGECTEIIKNEYATTKSSPNLNRLKSNYKFIDLSTKTLKRVREEKNKHRPLNWEEGERHKIWQQTQNRR